MSTTTATRLREALPPTHLPDAPATADHLRRVAELAASVGITAWRWNPRREQHEPIDPARPTVGHAVN